MKQTDLARHLTDFLGKYLSVECGMSTNTIKTYSYTFTLIFEFMKTKYFIKSENLCLSDLSKQRVIEFLSWLEDERKSSVSTRNARLAAIRSFFRYLQYRDVGRIAEWQDILSIKQKKAATPEMSYLSLEGIKLLLQQPDIHTHKGIRDFILLSLLYDSGCRVQELINLSPCDIRQGEHVTVKLLGKGQKSRIVPLSNIQASNLLKYINDSGLGLKENQAAPLFSNPQGNRLSRMAVLNIVKKYIKMAREIDNSLIPDGISCHSFRHSKAMHMLESEINLVYIRDFLGHSSTTTTEIYARASDKMKSKVLSKLDNTIVQEGMTSWQKDKGILEFLKNLQDKS